MVACYAVVSSVQEDKVGTTHVIMTVRNSPTINPFQIGQQVPFAIYANDLYFQVTCEFANADHLVTQETIAHARALQDRGGFDALFVEVPKKRLGTQQYYINLNGNQTQCLYLLTRSGVYSFPYDIAGLIVMYVFGDEEKLPLIDPIPQDGVTRWF